MTDVLQVPSGSRLEMMRMEIRDELERPYAQKFQEMESEIERCKSDVRQVCRQLKEAKCQSDAREDEHCRLIEELNLRHDEEVCDISCME